MIEKSYKSGYLQHGSLKEKGGKKSTAPTQPLPSAKRAGRWGGHQGLLHGSTSPAPFSYFFCPVSADRGFEQTEIHFQALQSAGVLGAVRSVQPGVQGRGEEVAQMGNGTRPSPGKQLGVKITGREAINSRLFFCHRGQSSCKECLKASCTSLFHSAFPL